MQTRRKVLTGAAVTLAALPTSVVRASDIGADAELLRLEAECYRLKAAWDETNRVYNDKQAIYFSRLPDKRRDDPMPESVVASLAAAFLTPNRLTEGDVQRLPEDHPFRVWTREQNRKYADAEDELDAIAQRLDAELGMRESARADDAAGTAFYKAVRAALETPAATFAGLAAKVRIYRLAFGEGGEHDDDDLALLFDDMERLAA